MSNVKPVSRSKTDAVDHTELNRAPAVGRQKTSPDHDLSLPNITSHMPSSLES